MYRRIKGLAIAILLIVAFVASNCGSSNYISGIWLQREYEGSISYVEVVAGVYNVGSTDFWYSSVAGPYQLSVYMSIENYYSYYPDTLTITVPDASTLIQGESYAVGPSASGIGVTMIVSGTYLAPSGYVKFTKLSLNKSRTVCGDFDLYVSGGNSGEFHGHFCGEVQIGL